MAFSDILDEWERQTGHRPQPSQDGYKGLCPVHKEKEPSLFIRETKEGKVYINCFVGCDWKDVSNQLGIREAYDGKKRKAKKFGTISATYDYRDQDGKLLFQVVRFDPKDFRQRQPDPNKEGAWKWNLKGVTRVIYNLSGVIEAVKNDETVWVVEGEKDVENLRTKGLVATTLPGGAGKWRSEYGKFFKGARVCLLPDHDEPGLKSARQICKALKPITKDIRLLELPELAPKQDVSNFLDNGNSTDDLQALYAATPGWTPVDDDDRETDVDTVTIFSKEPLRIAEHFLAAKFTDAEGRLALRRFRQVWYKFNGSAYEALDDETFKAELWTFIDGLMFNDGECDKKLEAKRNLVNEVFDALISRGVLVEGDAPQWLNSEEGQPDPIEIVPCRNGLFNLPARILLPSSPDFFTVTGLDYDFESEARPPTRWLAFLHSIFGDDVQSIEALQQWFGYVLTQDTRLQKILLIVGPKRSGKGTIAQILTRLLGQGNTTNPTMGGLSENFGLAPLLDKSLAIIGDAHILGQTSQAVIIERLLSISGEDGQLVNRKYLLPVNVKLSVRFMILTNELPRLTDASGALASRYIVLILHKSFLGIENPDLAEELLEELPGIFNWAIDGWFALREARRFVQPKSSAEALQAIEELGAPIAAFVREKCTVKSGASCYAKDLFEAWKSFCQEIGRDHPGNIQGFFKDLRALFPGLRVTQTTVDGKRIRICNGIKLNDFL